MEPSLRKSATRHPLYYIGTLLYGLWSILAVVHGRWNLRYMGYTNELWAKFMYLTLFLSHYFLLFLFLTLLFLAISGLKKSVSRSACTLVQVGLLSLIFGSFLQQVSSLTGSSVTIPFFLNNLPFLISGFVGNFVFPSASAILAIFYLKKYKHRQNTAANSILLSVFLFSTVLFQLADLLVCAMHRARLFTFTFWEYVFFSPFETFSGMVAYLCFGVWFLWTAKRIPQNQGGD